ncbi:hypothetical protein AMR42_16660 [Limnothrix sp. PR1529]|uniref:urease accessory protein UreD n=1 Tax=Limnothrix sp. PR1529 TaxID=1704291 RepID=UPI00081D38FA|nr:urease accessory protein UreD [Limnothrix sp. PR1529]OCQ91043.1 hypothetical protein BCR12_13380 [Limnothrix sp. P13C2]PIB04811.1 hypothetical protein AMR42_16660 [Limnothrix sp. PR1529]
MTVASQPTPETDRTWHGSFALRFDRSGDRTQVQAKTRSPLQFQRPFYPEGPEVCHAAMLHVAGGMVGGDRLSITLDLEPETAALVTTVSAAKIYGSRGRSLIDPAGRFAQQSVRVRVGEGAHLEWLPQETIIFDGALYEQRSHIDLATGASWLGSEIVRLGRTAGGERYGCGEWRSRLEVWQGDRLVWLDPQRIDATDPATRDGSHGLAGCPIVGTLAWIGQEVPKELITEARSHLPTGDRVDCGITRLQTGLLCRYRGHSVSEARRWFWQVWDLVRRHQRDRPAIVSRFWPL